MRRRDEGFVMVAVMVVMAFAIVLAGVAVAQSVQGRDASTKDVRAKRAQQAADAGLSMAVYRLNQLSLSAVNFSGGLAAVSQTIACQPLLTLGLTVDAGFTDASTTSGQCGTGQPAVPSGRFFSGETGDGTTVETFVTINGKPVDSNISTLAPTTIEPIIVSEGRDTRNTPTEADDVIRRVSAKLSSVAPFAALEARGNLVFSTTGLVTTTTLNGSAKVNGNVTVNGGTVAGTFVNSNISVLPLGVTGSIAYQGSRLPGSGLVNVNLTTFNETSAPPVDPDDRTPVTIATTKPDCPGGSCPSGYDATARSFVLGNGTDVTLPGGDYVFCRVWVKDGATLRTSPTAGKPVRIYVDHPKSARCLGKASDLTASPASRGVNGNVTITGRINPGVSVSPSQLQIYTAGPPSGVAETDPRTVAEFNTTNGASVPPGFFFYGPTTNVTLTYSTFTGSLIGNDVTLRATTTGTFTQDLNVNNLPLSNQLGTFRQKEYTECSARDVDATNSTTNC